MPSPRKEPQDRKKPAKKASAAKKTAAQEPVAQRAVILVDGVRYEIVESEFTPLDVLAVRRATGFSLQDVFRLFFEAPDLDIVAIILWLARRTNGEPTLAFEEVAASFSYSSNFELEFVDAKALTSPET